MSTFALVGRMGHHPSCSFARALARRSAVAAAALALALTLLAPAASFGVPAPNDHYLASTIVRDAKGAFPREWTGTADTTEATTQGDLFQPNREGQPLGGGAPEPLSCGSATFGKTVWWDITPPLTGAFELRVDGFDTAIAVYEFDPRSSQIKRQVACAATPGAPEKLTLPETLKAGRSYTVQVGGVVAPDSTVPSGVATLAYSYFPDRDDDGVLDVLPDRCPDLPGVQAYGGCPPTLKPTVSYGYRAGGGGVTLDRLRVADVPAGTKVRVRAGGWSATRTSTGGALTFGAAVGKRLRSGTALEVRATLDRGDGVYVHGAIGADVRLRVTGNRIGSRTSRCLVPGDARPRKSCKRVKR